MVPTVAGTKLIDSSHELPGASVPAVAEPAFTRGHAELALLFNVKLDDMLGLLPEFGTGKSRGALPVFWIVTVCGLSLLGAPYGVDAKLRLGGSITSIFHTLPDLEL